MSLNILKCTYRFNVFHPFLRDFSCRTTNKISLIKKNLKSNKLSLEMWVTVALRYSNTVDKLSETSNENHKFN